MIYEHTPLKDIVLQQSQGGDDRPRPDENRLLAGA